MIDRIYLDDAKHSSNEPTKNCEATKKKGAGFWIAKTWSFHAAIYLIDSRNFSSCGIATDTRAHRSGSAGTEFLHDVHRLTNAWIDYQEYTPLSLDGRYL